MALVISASVLNSEIAIEDSFSRKENFVALL
jgi:hypothetical protein